MIVGWRCATHMRTEMVLDAIEMARSGTWGSGTCSIQTACPVEHGPAKTLFVKGKSFPALYDTIRDDPGALHKVHREGAALILVGTALMIFCPAMAATPIDASSRDEAASAPLLTEPRFIALLLPVLAAGLVVGTVYVAVPAMIDTLGNAAAVGVVLALFAAGSAVGDLAYGALQITVSSQRQLVILATLFITASAGAGLAPSTISLGLVISAAGLFLSPIMIVAYFAANDFGGTTRQTESTT